MQVGGNGVDLVGLYLLALIVNIAGVLWATGIAMVLILVGVVTATARRRPVPAVAVTPSQ